MRAIYLHSRYALILATTAHGVAHRALPVATAGDSATFFGAVAAAAGALVAIMGGFLISRVVGLLGQREGFEQRSRELIGRRRLVGERLATVYAERSAVTAEWFDKAHLTDMVAARGDLDRAELANDSRYIGSTAEEIEALIDRRVAQITAAVSAIEEARPSGPLWSLEDVGVTPPAGEQEIWKQVLQALHAERMPSTSFMSPFVPTAKIVYERQDKRIEQEQSLRAELRALDAEMGLLADERRRLQRTPALVGAIAILAYFAGASVALPLTLLLLAPVPSGPFARWGTLALFIIGLALLLGYLAVSVAQLRSSSDARVPVADCAATGSGPALP